LGRVPTSGVRSRTASRFRARSEDQIMHTSCTVLLVENNPDDARLAELAFERAKVPHALMVLPDGREALDYLDGKGRYLDRGRFPLPKLVLLDLAMPGINGFDLLERLRQEKQFQDLPVTVLSGSAYRKDVTRAYELGANSFLFKPSDFPNFTAAIKEAVGFWLGTPRLTHLPVYLQMPARSVDF
jgi:two-component system, response regulator